MTHMFRNLCIRLGVGASMLLPMAASAQLAPVAPPGGGAADPQALPRLIGNMISALLGVLGIVFVVLIVYAGIMYMTAAGNDEKVKKAKQLIVQAVIGLIIIVLAYAIANFVIGALTTATA